MKPTTKTKLTHLLLMEDESTVAHLVQLHLQGRGYAVDIAEDGQKGLEMLDAGYYDLLIVDERMPRLSGLDVIRRLKQREAPPPVILMSGLGREDVAVEALKLGALDYLIKDGTPKFLETMPAAIAAALKKHRETEALRAAGEERNRWLHELKQRVRELGCLYGIERLFASEGESLDTVLQGATNLIPRACQNPDACWAHLRLRDQDFRSDGFAETPWKQSFVLRMKGKLVGSLEVGWREKPPEGAGPLFTPEEMELLSSVADRTAHFVERWHTEHELLQIHAELRKLSLAVEQSASAVMITDAQGNIEYVNPAFTDMTGYAEAEVVGKNPRLLKSGERGPEEYRQLWETIAAGRQWRGEFHNRKKNGELYWDYSTISPVVMEGAGATHYVAVKEDITARKEAEALQRAVLAVSARIAGCQTEDEICRVTVEGVRQHMGIDRGGLFLGHPNHPPFRGTYGTDLAGNTVDEHDHVWDIGKERDVEDLFRRGSFKTGFPLGRPDALPGEEGLTATLIALRQGGEVFGVISLDNRISRRPVTQAQMMHIALLAEVLGNALQVARGREALRRSMEELKRANDELEAFNWTMVGRENRIIELKEEINRLLVDLGHPPRYPAVWNQPDETAAPQRGEKK